MSIGCRLGARLGYWRTLRLATVGAVWWMVGGGCIQPRSYVSAAERCKMGVPGACSPDVCATYGPGEVPPGCLEDAAGGDLDVASDLAPDALAEDLGPADTHALDETPSVADVAADGWVEDGVDVAEGDVASDAVPDGSAEDTLEDVASADADVVADTLSDADVAADGWVEDAPDADADAGLDAGDAGAVDADAVTDTLSDADAVADGLVEDAPNVDVDADVGLGAGDADPCTSPSAGCPCDFNGKAAGVCGTAVYGSDEVCVQPLGFETTEVSCDDGLDNDCDGVTDEPCADGVACNDDDPCTAEDIWKNGECHGHLEAFTATYGGDKDDQIGSLRAMPDGGFVLLGSTKSMGNGNPDWWLVRTDSTGVVQWDKPYGGDLVEEASDVIVLSNGGLAMVGYTTTSGGAGKSDGWLVTTNATGFVWWSHTYGGADYDTLHSVAELPNKNNDGGFVMAGRTASTDNTLNDVWLVRTTEDGTKLWEKTYGGPQQDDAYAVLALEDGEFVVAGYTGSNDTDNYQGWLLRTDSTGLLEWNHKYGDAQSDDYFYDAVALSDGGFAAVGCTAPKDTGSKDFWLVRTDPNGGLDWAQAYGGSDDDVASAVAALPDGGFALAGYTQSSGAGGKDLWLVRTDANGLLLWDKTFGGAGDDWASALVTLPDGGFAMGGTNSSEGAGLMDFWLVRTDDQGNASCP